MANNLVRIIIAGVQVVGRAFTRAVQKEFAASKHAAEKAGGGASGAKSAASTGFHGMTVEEAQKILNVENINGKDQIEKTYQHLMKVNEKSQGGSFYIQSKVFRAKERIDAELGERDKEKGDQDQ